MVTHTLSRPARARALLAAALTAAACAAHAQTYHDFAGTTVTGVMPLPYTFTPLPPGQHNLAAPSATALNVPTGAQYAIVCASTAAAKYTTDGVTTPTGGVGQPLAAGACVSLSGPAVIANFSVVSPSGSLDVEYFR